MAFDVLNTDFEFEVRMIFRSKLWNIVRMCSVRIPCQRKWERRNFAPYLSPTLRLTWMPFQT